MGLPFGMETNVNVEEVIPPVRMDTAMVAMVLMSAKVSALDVLLECVAANSGLHALIQQAMATASIILLK